MLAHNDKPIAYIPNLDGRCSVRLAEDLSKALGVPVPKVIAALEDAARTLPAHIKITATGL